MAKSKDPAFLLYSSDFLIGCAEMTNEETGQYIRILCYMHQKGRLSEESICILVGSVFPRVSLKFCIDNNGLWFNEDLEEVIEKRKAFIQSRRKNGQKGGKSKKNKGLYDNSPDNYAANAEANGKANEEASALARVKHMENEIYIENLNENVNKFFKEGGMGGTTQQDLYAKGISSSGGPPLSEVNEYFSTEGYSPDAAREFWDYYEGQGWITGGGRGQPVKNWRAKVFSFVKNLKYKYPEETNGNVSGSAVHSAIKCPSAFNTSANRGTGKRTIVSDVTATKIKFGIPVTNQTIGHSTEAQQCNTEKPGL